MTDFECRICGYPYPTLDQAWSCESKGLKENQLQVGDILVFPGNLTFEVVRLLAASCIDHEPGVAAKLIAGNISFLFVDGPAPDEHIFDQETALRRRVTTR